MVYNLGILYFIDQFRCILSKILIVILLRAGGRGGGYGGKEGGDRGAGEGVEGAGVGVEGAGII